jgi:hypothetical protein
MKSIETNQHLEILKKLHGVFPCDAATRHWRTFFILFGWIIIPGVSICAVLEDSPPTAATLCLATGLLLFGLVWGYICWIGKGHQFQIEEGEIKSIGRKILWRLPIEEIRSVRIYRSGDFVIWWLKTSKTERGLRIYPSLNTAIQKIIEQGRGANALPRVAHD